MWCLQAMLAHVYYDSDSIQFYTKKIFTDQPVIEEWFFFNSFYHLNFTGIVSLHTKDLISTSQTITITITSKRGRYVYPLQSQLGTNALFQHCAGPPVNTVTPVYCILQKLFESTSTEGNKSGGESIKYITNRFYLWLQYSKTQLFRPLIPLLRNGLNKKVVSLLW